MAQRIKSTTSNGEDVYFDLTLIVDKNRDLTVVDNLQKDYHDLIDFDTIAVQKVKLEVDKKPVITSQEEVIGLLKMFKRLGKSTIEIDLILPMLNKD